MVMPQESGLWKEALSVACRMMVLNACGLGDKSVSDCWVLGLKKLLRPGSAVPMRADGPYWENHPGSTVCAVTAPAGNVWWVQFSRDLPLHYGYIHFPLGLGLLH